MKTSKRRQRKGPPPPVNVNGGNGGGGGFKFKLVVGQPVYDPVIRKELETYDPNLTEQPDRSHLTDEQSEALAYLIRTNSQLEQVIHIATQTGTYGGVSSSVTVDGTRYMIRDTDHELKRTPDGGSLMLWKVTVVPVKIAERFDDDDIAEFAAMNDDTLNARALRDEDIADDIRDHERDEREEE